MKQNKTQTKGNKSGFTLIELIVAIFITVTISTITLVNFRKGEKQRAVNLAVDTIINGIRNAQNYTLTAKSIQASTCVDGKAPKYYLMEFNNNHQMKLFGVDKCDTLNLIESYSLSQGTRIKTQGYRLGNSNVESLQFLFTPPFAKMTVSTSNVTYAGSFADFANARIYLESSDSTINKTILIDGVSGKIE